MVIDGMLIIERISPFVLFRREQNKVFLREDCEGLWDALAHGGTLHRCIVQEGSFAGWTGSCVVRESKVLAKLIIPLGAD